LTPCRACIVDLSPRSDYRASVGDPGRYQGEHAAN
jgi:hypothetical protein